MKLRIAFCAPAFISLLALPALARQSTPPLRLRRNRNCPDAPTATPEAATVPNGPFVVMDTSMGRMTCQFYQKQAPNAVANFIALAEGTKDWTDPTTNKVQHHKPLYNGTTFHRVIPEFMIQGGDPTGTGMGGPGYALTTSSIPDLNFDGPAGWRWPTPAPTPTAASSSSPSRRTPRSISTTRSLASATTQRGSGEGDCARAARRKRQAAVAGDAE